MEFWDYTTAYQCYTSTLGRKEKKQSRLEYYEQLQKDLVRIGASKASLVYTFEYYWSIQGRPYYSIYPSIIPSLTNIDLNNIKINQVPYPSGLQNLLMRFPKSSPFNGVVKSFGLLMGRNPDDADEACVSLIVDDAVNKKRSASGRYAFPIWGGGETTIGEICERVTGNGDATFDYRGEGVPAEIVDCMEGLFKIAVTLCLLGDSPELIQPEVLNADEHKLQGQHNIEALVAKARRRGKYGFTIGKDIEVMPHYRRPHLALVWYGPGKKKSKIIPRKGSIVHRSKVEKIPTGYAAEEVEA